MNKPAFRLNEEEQQIIKSYCDILEATIVPFRFEGNNKRPNVVSWEEYKTRRNTPEELEKWLPTKPAFGIVAGKLNCVDFDIIKDENSEFYKQLHPKAIDFYNELIGSHPSWAQETGSGGKHIIYEAEEGFPVETRKIPDIPGLEIRGLKSLFIVAPSYHPTGNQYKTIRCPFKDGISLFPYSEFNPDKNVSINGFSFPKKAYENLLDRGHLIEGSRNDEITSCGGLIYSRLADKPQFARDILFALNQYYADLGKSEPLPDKDLLAIIKGQETKYHPKENKLPPVLFLHEIKNIQLPKTDWKVENIVPEKGITVIFGAPGEYKSWVRTCISIACARGELLFGKYKTKKSKVLLVDKDNDMYQTLARFTMLGVDVENEKIDIAFYILAFDFVVEDKSEIDKLKKYIIENDIDIVIFDTFKDIFNGDENSSKDVGMVISFLKSLSLLNVASILVHHTKKNTEDEVKDVAQLARGSTALWGGAHSMLFVHKPEKDESKLAIYHAKNKYRKPEQPILLNIEETGDEIKGFSYAGVAESYSPKGQSAQGRAEKQIISLFTLSETELLRNNIVAQVKQTGCKESAINEALGNLTESERLTKRTEGKGKNRKTYFRLQEGKG